MNQLVILWTNQLKCLIFSLLDTLTNLSINVWNNDAFYERSELHTLMVTYITITEKLNPYTVQYSTVQQFQFQNM